MQLRSTFPTDHQEILELTKALPEWFTPTGIEALAKDLQSQKGFAAISENGLIGFLTYFVDQQNATISWMGVHPKSHRQGIGEKLINELKNFLRSQNIRSISVGTLGDSVDYEPYARTRAFYRKNGFKDFQRIAHPENPEQEEELILKLYF